jgi:hypothetical protein
MVTDGYYRSVAYYFTNIFVGKQWDWNLRSLEFSGQLTTNAATPPHHMLIYINEGTIR